MRKLLFLGILIISVYSVTAKTKYPKGVDTFIVENYDHTEFAQLQKKLILSGYTIENYDRELKIIQTKAKVITGSPHAQNLTNTIVCYIENNQLIIFSTYSFEDSIAGAGSKESGRARYEGSKIAGPRMAFIETEKFLLTTNLKFKVIKQ
jgi:hypothetical protein